jgi:hypothetical protein
MKTSTKTLSLKKKSVKKIDEELLSSLTGKEIMAVEEYLGESLGKKKYTATIKMGSEITEAQGNDESILGALSLPKVTNKCTLKVTNNDNKKSFEVVYPPYMAKKVLVNDFVQKFQWKRIVGKLA